MTPDRQPTRDDLRKATMLGLLAAKQQRPASSCRFTTKGAWDSGMREAWLAGYADTAAFE